ncbi:MAG: Ribosomal RNA small subunit methyltransferase E [Lentisphaerae bacterium ADurb.Bin242]|nr:MAG: Ribosomal RNA small subunit methyltransferase E [Lentisphaerae bacterium ADurb.Bin242]
MHRFRYENLSGCRAGDIVSLNKEEGAHLFRTLRAEEGDVCTLLDGAGRLATAVVSAGKTLRILELAEIPPPPAPLLHLYIAPPRRPKMDQILRQITELGVWRIVPLVCERSVSLPDNDSVNGRWKELLFDACKQSGNPFLPRTAAPMRFAEALSDSAENCPARYFGSVTERVENNSSAGVPSAAAWFVGPEGGFTEAEERSLLACGMNAVHFGNWTLRVETAAVCGICVLQDRFSSKNSVNS